MWREQQERSGEMVRGRLPGGQVPFGALFFFAPSAALVLLLLLLLRLLLLLLLYCYIANVLPLPLAG